MKNRLMPNFDKSVHQRCRDGVSVSSCSCPDQRSSEGLGSHLFPPLCQRIQGGLFADRFTGRYAYNMARPSGGAAASPPARGCAGRRVVLSARKQSGKQVCRAIYSSPCGYARATKGRLSSQQLSTWANRGADSVPGRRVRLSANAVTDGHADLRGSGHQSRPVGEQSC